MPSPKDKDVVQTKGAREQQHPGLHIPWHLRSHKGNRIPAVVDNPIHGGWFRKIVRSALFLCIVLTAIVIVFALFIFQRYATGIPMLHSLKQYRPALPSEFYSAGGEKIAEFAGQKRVLVPYHDTSRP